ncbi:MAG: hypothetical protein LBM25_07135 [Bacteroidales bacterium]|jgi:hypothetical protein|nr:hypothetical protein [Bacteroidales bacterium]
MKKITKDNYPAYFIDFIEGKLSKEEEKTLEDFLEENPKLKEELQEYSPEIYLKAEENIHYEKKEELKRGNIYIIPQFIRYASIAAAIILAFILIKPHIFNAKQEETSSQKEIALIEQKIDNKKIVAKEVILDKGKEKKIIAKTRIRKEKENINKEKLEKAEPLLNKEEIVEKKEGEKVEEIIYKETTSIVYYKEFEDIDFNNAQIVEVTNMIVKDSVENNKKGIMPFEKFAKQVKYNFDKGKDYVETKIEWTQENIVDPIVRTKDRLDNIIYRKEITKR